MHNKKVDIRQGDEPFPFFSINRLRYARMCRNLTQQQLADRAGVTQPTISEIELGHKQRVKPKMMRHISQALNISHNWLFDEKGCLRP